MRLWIYIRARAWKETFDACVASVFVRPTRDVNYGGNLYEVVRWRVINISGVRSTGSLYIYTRMHAHFDTEVCIIIRARY